ncbi:hypothetical protein Y032_0118g724 [Ancylostoma ceylanicum]|nr:hypothetical protein Y032_0118g724 [Ancylostoma ceylanicum]
MRILEAAFFLAFVATAQEGCTFTRVKDEFTGREYQTHQTNNLLHCLRICYNEFPRCEAIMLTKDSCGLHSSKHSFPSIYTLDGYKFQRSANESCRKVEI